MLNLITKALNLPCPVRTGIAKVVQTARIGSYPFRVAIGAVERPHYAYLLLSAAQLAKKLQYERISVVEYGVAGGRGLVALEAHADQIEKLLSVKIEIYGFDTGVGLPRPRDHRDLPYHWREGFFAMNEDKLRSTLHRSNLVLGDIEETSRTFFDRYKPAPIGAVIHDFDFYSSTAVALGMLNTRAERYLPRVFCYFDDTMGTGVELYNDFTGERLAIHEFNRTCEDIKLSPAYYLRARKPEPWHHQIWIGHFLKHPHYNTFISESDQQLAI